MLKISLAPDFFGPISRAGRIFILWREFACASLGASSFFVIYSLTGQGRVINLQCSKQAGPPVLMRIVP